MSRDDKKSGRDLAAEIGKREAFDSPAQEAYLNLARTHQCLAAEFDRLFAEHGLTDPQYNALRILRGQGRPMHVYQVAEQMVTRQPDITRLIDRLEQAGLARRERCVEDRRVVWVTITPDGKALLAKLDRPLRDLHQRQLGHLSETKLRSLSRLLFEARRSPDIDG